MHSLGPSQAIDREPGLKKSEFKPGNNPDSPSTKSKLEFRKSGIKIYKVQNGKKGFGFNNFNKEMNLILLWFYIAIFKVWFCAFQGFIYLGLPSQVLLFSSKFMGR